MPSTGVPRRPREDFEGAVHHVFARGNDRHDIYVDNVDRRNYLAILGPVTLRQRWRCLSYCLMPNHVHLLVETPHANLGAGMQRLHGEYAHTFNRRHGRCGHVFQGRFGSIRIATDEHLWSAAAYIALNPVTAGLCRAPEDWRWSSHASTTGARRRPGWLDSARLLSYFEGLGGDPLDRYLALTGADSPELGPLGRAAATVSRR
jgi:putative transposase